MEIKTSITKNYLYNLAYQIISIMLPLITLPYIARVLGSGGLGIYVFTFAIVQYAVLVASLGISFYGNKEIAATRDNIEKRNKTFCNLLYLNIISSLSVFFTFILVLILTNYEYKQVLLIQSLNILALTFDISWFFMGLEDFKKTVLRNIFVKIIGLILIFTLVKNANDVCLYTFIISATSLIGNITFWFYLPDLKIKLLKPDFKMIRKFLWPAFLLLLPQIASQIYWLFGKLMLGAMSFLSEAAFYDTGVKICAVLLTLGNSLSIILLPRLSNTIANGQFEENKKYLNDAMIFNCFICFPIAAGIFVISDTFVPWFLGHDFLKTIIILKLLSFILLMIPISNLLANQLIALNKFKNIIICTFIGVFVNIISNLILIPKIYAIGASISTLLTEFIMTVYIIFILKEYILFDKINKELSKIILCSLVTGILLETVKIHLPMTIVSTVSLIIIEVFAYLSLLKIFKSDTLAQITNKIKIKLLQYNIISS